MSQASPPPGVHPALRYRPDIDGLRAVAVLPVVLFHAGVASFGGGFVGVDIFFVISGYLIMSTIAADMARDRFTILGFYERRIRRIFPALFVMAAFCAIVGAFVLPPNDFKQFGESLLAMAGFVSNLFFEFFGDQGGYFDTRWEPQLLLHTWSLSVEEQFYIFLPPGLLLLRKYSPARMRWSLIAVCVSSFVLSAIIVRFDAKVAFFLVITRAWELLVGTLLALKMKPPLSWRPAREGASLVGLAMILYAILAFSNLTPFPGPSALLPCMGSVLIIYAGEAGPTLVGRLLSLRPIVFIGLISYSLYLWHWPFVVLAKRITMGHLTPAWITAVVVASFVAATLSWRFVERPFRGRGFTLTRRQILAGGGIASGAAFVLGLVIAVGQGLPERYDPRTRAILATNFQRQYDIPKGHCTNWLKDVHQIGDIAECRIGADAKNILFLGDSQVDTLRPLIQQLYDEKALDGRGAVFTIDAGCPPSVNTNTAAGAFHCNTFFKLAIERAEASDVETVFIAFAAGWDQSDDGLCLIINGACGRLLSRVEAEANVLSDLSSFIITLKQNGKRVIVGLPAPIYSLHIPVFEINNVIYGALRIRLTRDDLIPLLGRSDFVELREKVASMAKSLGAETYDFRKDLCHGDDCLFQRDHVSIYVDAFHLATKTVDIYHDSLREALRRRVLR